RHPRAVTRRAHRDAGGRHLHPGPLPGRARLLRRFQHGAPAYGACLDRDDSDLQAHRHQAEGERIMTGTQLGQVILALIVVAALLAIVAWLLNWFDLRSSKERAVARTSVRGHECV